MVYIVIAVFNRLSYTKACLHSLRQQNFPDYKIVLVDHGSTDGTASAIRDEFPEVILLNENNSLWWTGATNRGIQRVLEMSASDKDFILTLNNDLVVEPGYLSELLRVYNANQPAIVGSLSVNYSDVEKIDFAGVKWNNIAAKYQKNPEAGIPFSELKKERQWVASDLLPGRGTLFPIRVFRDFGLFDEKNFPHYAADEDFTLACKKNGYKLLVAVNAFVRSHVEQTGTNFRHSAVNLKRFLASLSSIKSANNLSVRYKWAKKNSPLPYVYFLFDTTRIFGSYIRSVIKLKETKKATSVLK
jgi:GT2 family glycosyltransferase